MDVNMYVKVDVDDIVNELIRNMSGDDLIRLILELDLGVAEFEFTEELILKLVHDAGFKESFYSKKDWKNFIKKLGDFDD